MTNRRGLSEFEAQQLLNDCFEISESSDTECSVGSESDDDAFHNVGAFVDQPATTRVCNIKYSWS